MRFVVIDRCPVPAEIAEQVAAIKRKSGADLQSAYRGDLATNLLKRLGKMTQRMLWDGWRRRLPGFNPANRPKQSTHELFSDAHAYRGPVGRPIKAWGCGLDWGPPDKLDDVDRAARELGFDLFRPYKDGREAHHRNFRRYPKVARVRKRKQRRAASKLRQTQITKAGVKFIADFEGFRPTPYKPVPTEQHLTIGFGHYGPDVKPGMRLTRDQAFKLLDKDLNRFEAGVAHLVKAPLTPLQFDALASFAFNVGVGALQDSTLLRELNKKHYARAANEFLRWDKSGGRPLAGLTRRRRAERAMFLKGSSRKTRIAAEVRR